MTIKQKLNSFIYYLLEIWRMNNVSVQNLAKFITLSIMNTITWFNVNCLHINTQY